MLKGNNILNYFFSFVLLYVKFNQQLAIFVILLRIESSLYNSTLQ